MRRAIATLGLAAALVTSGCGDDGQTDATSGEAETSVAPAASDTSTAGGSSGAPDEAAVLAHLGAEDDVVTLDDGTRCEIAAVATSAAQVGTYEDAGDTVAKTPDGSVGVTIAGAEAAACQAELTQLLAGLESAS